MAQRYREHIFLLGAWLCFGIALAYASSTVAGPPVVQWTSTVLATACVAAGLVVVIPSSLPEKSPDRKVIAGSPSKGSTCSASSLQATQESSLSQTGDRQEKPEQDPSGVAQGCLSGVLACLYEVADGFRRRARSSSGSDLQDSVTVRQSVPDPSGCSRLLEQGRYMQALRILDAFADDSAVPDAAFIREVAGNVNDTLSTLERAAQDPGAGWKESNQEGLQMLYKYDQKTGQVELIGNMEFSCPPLHLWALAREFDLCPAWNRSTLTCACRGRFEGESELYFSENKPLIKGFFKPTECYLERTYVDTLEECGRLLVLSRSPPLEATSHKDATIPAPSAKVKRITSTGQDILTPLSENSVRFTIHRLIQSPFRGLPDWVVRKGANSSAKSAATNLRGVLEAFQGGEHERRVREGPRAEYYSAIQLRILETLNRRN
eukprot:TRINITY_DN81040_c0_g1_i1.p1 TRINITY_DN81040_c0_g1~~TRINITY_DN81040_c0_g1_i1.p1  ORF type:complete len:435 (+),score=63.06 TRINITY_DN81040_c0_g1_i1:79-1383(+)